MDNQQRSPNTRMCSTTSRKTYLSKLMTRETGDTLLGNAKGDDMVCSIRKLIADAKWVHRVSSCDTY